MLLLTKNLNDTLRAVAEHWNLDMYKLLQSVAVQKPSATDDNFNPREWYIVPELLEHFAQDTALKAPPTRRRVVLSYAAKMQKNPFSLDELLASMPLPEGYESWYTRKTLGHALGFALIEEREWYNTSRLTEGREDKWFVVARKEPHGAITCEDLQRLYPIDAEECHAILNGAVSRLYNDNYTVVHLMHDCRRPSGTLDSKQLFNHIFYGLTSGFLYERRERLMASLVDYVFDACEGSFCYTEYLRRTMVERDIGHPFIYLSQEAFGVQLKRALQSQEHRGRLSASYRLERKRSGTAWLWKAVKS